MISSKTTYLFIITTVQTNHVKDSGSRLSPLITIVLKIWRERERNYIHAFNNGMIVKAGKINHAGSGKINSGRPGSGIAVSRE